MFLLVDAIIHKQICSRAKHFFEYFYSRIGIWEPIALLTVIIVMRINTSRCPRQIKNYLTECPKQQKRQYFMTYIYVQRELRRISYDLYIRPKSADLEYWWASKNYFLKIQWNSKTLFCSVKEIPSVSPNWKKLLCNFILNILMSVPPFIIFSLIQWVQRRTYNPVKHLRWSFLRI